MFLELENVSKEELIKLLQSQQKQTANVSRERDNFKEERDGLKDENLHLKLLLEKYKRLAFGQKRERFEGNPAQILLPFVITEAAQQQLQQETVEKISYERKKAKPSAHAGRQPLPDHLPVEEINIHPDGDLSAMVCIGTEVTEELDYKPGSYFIRRFIRHRYAPKDKAAEGKGTIVTPPLPPRAIDKCIAGPGLLAQILVDKYVDHLPLYRQGQRFKRENIPIAASTLEGWARQSMGLLDVLYGHLLKQTRSKGYLQVDESTIRVQDRAKKGKCHLGYYWVYHCPLDGTVLFDYQPGRGAAAASHLLSGFRGYLQTDGYAAYEQFGAGEGVTHLNCWAHARREFTGALGNDRDRAEVALAFIRTLYEVEANAREKKLSTEERKKLRLDRSLPVLNAFVKWMTGELKAGNVLPKSPIGKAMHYSLERWDELSNYLHDGSLEIDNNLVENAIRPVALGRKNYLFAGSHEAAQRSAMLYSLLGTCKLHGINPAVWLEDVLRRIGDHPVNRIGELLPHRWAPLQSSAESGV